MEQKKRKLPSTNSTLLNFFRKKPGPDENIEKSDDVSGEKYVENKNLTQAVQETNKREHFDARKNDIGLFIRRDLLSDEEKATKRLNGLAMLAIHNDITLSNEEVIDELAKKPRNLDIIL